MKLIIQIPAFNEAGNIAATIRDLPKRIAGINVIEVLVIDDGSSDGTAAAARAAGARHVLTLSSHRGLAAAFTSGIEHALRLGADIIVNTDGDQQYAGADIAKLVEPIVAGNADVVIGDRETSKSPHMGAVKRFLQRFGSAAVGLAAGRSIPDVTSGFRAFSREAALQLNVFNPFTYTLETIIQAGQRNLTVLSVPVRTNPPTRPSRLYKGNFNYIRKSVVTIFRIYALYRPLKTFFAIGAILFLIGFFVGARFLWFYAAGEGGGHVQSLILAAIFLIIGFQTMLIGLLADLISVNRRLSEEILIRTRRAQSESGGRVRQRKQDQAPRPAGPRSTPVADAPAGEPKAEPQWVWLIDEDRDVRQPAAGAVTPAPEEAKAGTTERRRRRRRGGARHFGEARRHHPRHRDEQAPEPPSPGESSSE